VSIAMKTLRENAVFPLHLKVRFSRPPPFSKNFPLKVSLEVFRGGSTSSPLCGVLQRDFCPFRRLRPFRILRDLPRQMSGRTSVIAVDSFPLSLFLLPRRWLTISSREPSSTLDPRSFPSSLTRFFCAFVFFFGDDVPFPPFAYIFSLRGTS